MPPIARKDVVRAGGRILVQSFAGLDLMGVSADLTDFPVWLLGESMWIELEAPELPRTAEAPQLHLWCLDQNSPDWGGGIHFREPPGTNLTPLQRRRIFAVCIAPSDPEAAIWLSEDDASQPDIDAQLYVAVEQGDQVKAQELIRSGADPLRSTAEGDCAARLGVAGGMVDLFHRPEHLNATTARTGESGMHRLCFGGDLEQVLKAVSFGGRMGAKSHCGRTPWDECWLRPTEDVQAIQARVQRLSLLEQLSERAGLNSTRKRF